MRIPCVAGAEKAVSGSASGKYYISLKNDEHPTAADENPVISSTENPAGYTTIASIRAVAGKWDESTLTRILPDVTLHDGMPNEHWAIRQKITAETDGKIKSHDDNPLAHEEMRDDIDTVTRQRIGDHNFDQDAHSAIQSKIAADIAAHNTSAAAHADIRSSIPRKKWISTTTISGTLKTVTSYTPDGIITMPGHGYANGAVLSCEQNSAAMPDELEALKNSITLKIIDGKSFVYVVGATADTFQVAKTYNGTPLTLTGGAPFKVMVHGTKAVVPGGWRENEANVRYTIRVTGTAMLLNDYASALYWRIYGTNTTVKWMMKNEYSSDRFDFGTHLTNTSTIPFCHFSCHIDLCPTGAECIEVAAKCYSGITARYPNTGYTSSAYGDVAETGGFSTREDGTTKFKARSVGVVQHVFINGTTITVEGEYID